MKTLKSIFTMAIIVMASASLGAAWEENTSIFSLSFFGGMNYLTGGGINYYFLQVYPDFNKLASKTQHTLSGQLDPIHWGTDFAGEISIRLKRNLSLALGSGFMRSATDANRDWLALTPVHQTATDLKYTWNTDITTVSLTLDLRGSFHLGGRFFLYAGIGPGLYMARLKNEVDATLNGSFQWDLQNVSGTAVGAQGTLGLEFRISGEFSLLLEVSGRYAQCDSLTGNSTCSNADPSSGTLYYYKSNGFPCFNVLAIEPSGAGLEDVRKVELNLSGGAVRLGVRIRI